MFKNLLNISSLQPIKLHCQNQILATGIF